MFIGRTDVEAETPILWPPHAKSWLTGKDPDAGKDWGKEEKGTTEDKMVGWHHQLNEPGFGWIPGFGDGQGGLACCDSWGHKKSDTTEQLNWTEPNHSCVRTVGLKGIFFYVQMFVSMLILSLYDNHHSEELAQRTSQPITDSLGPEKLHTSTVFLCFHTELFLNDVSYHSLSFLHFHKSALYRHYLLCCSQPSQRFNWQTPVRFIARSSATSVGTHVLSTVPSTVLDIY